MMKFPLLVLASASLVVVGCGSTGAAPTTANSTTAPKKWSIELQVSGGFAGIRQLLIINSRGELQAVDLKRSKKVTKPVGKQQLLEVFDLLKKVKNMSLGMNKPLRMLSRCNDCLQYALIVDIEGRRQSVGLDSLSVRDSPYRALVDKLSLLLRQSLVGASRR